MKLSLVTLGCSKNQTDSEFLLAALSDVFEITANLDEASIIVLSPCSFLNDSRVEALEYIKDLIKYKNNKCKCLVVTGCYAEFLKDDVFDQAKEIDIAIGFSDTKTFIKAINDFLKFGSNLNRKYISGNGNAFGLFEEKNIHRVSLNSHYSYLKISEGCNNGCAYCLIPTIKGLYRSRKKSSIVAEANSLVENGIKEINIVSQDVGAYGIDIYKKSKYSFYNLLDKISDIDAKFWIRLLYMYPKHVDEKLVQLIKSKDNICNYIDMPLQHINDNILKLMRRNSSKSVLLDKILMLKSEIPNISLRTTFILGFPGETNKNFDELCEFVAEGYFDRVGVFEYSNEKGTKAYDFPLQVPDDEKSRRAKILMDIQEKVSLEKNKKFINKTFDFIPEEIFIKDNVIKGRIFNMAPEVDGFVYAKYDKSIDITKKIKSKKFLKAKIDECNSYDLYAHGV